MYEQIEQSFLNEIKIMPVLSTTKDAEIIAHEINVKLVKTYKAVKTDYIEFFEHSIEDCILSILNTRIHDSDIDGSNSDSINPIRDEQSIRMIYVCESSKLVEMALILLSDKFKDIQCFTKSVYKWTVHNIKSIYRVDTNKDVIPILARQMLDIINWVYKHKEVFTEFNEFSSKSIDGMKQHYLKFMIETSINLKSCDDDTRTNYLKIRQTNMICRQFKQYEEAAYAIRASKLDFGPNAIYKPSVEYRPNIVYKSVEHKPAEQMVKHKPAEQMVKHKPAEQMVEHNPVEQVEHNPVEQVEHKPMA